MQRAGAFIWHDLVSSDISCSVKFLTAVFEEWDVKTITVSGPRADEEEEYSTIAVKSQEISGLVPLRNNDEAGHILPYIKVDSVDRAVRLAANNGGSVVLPHYTIPGVGEFAVLLDPWGAKFAVWKNSAEYENAAKEGKSRGADSHHFGWHELLCHEVQAATVFYGRLFGWRFFQQFPGYTVICLPGHSSIKGTVIGSITKIGRGSARKPSWISYVTIPSVKGTTASAVKRGAHVVTEPVRVIGFGTYSVLEDPSGVVFGIAQEEEGKRSERSSVLVPSQVHVTSSNNFGSAGQTLSKFDFGVDCLWRGNGVRIVDGAM
eukprot:Colp12_sorted_trinity150504_noHs@19